MMVGVSIPPVLRAVRLWRWLILLFTVGGLLYTLELSVIRNEGSHATNRWKQWVSPSSVEVGERGPSVKQEPVYTEQLDDLHRNTILPSASGRVLVTGGGGVIGKRVVRRLLQANIPVTVLDTVFFQDEEDLIREDWPLGDLRVLRGDLRDPAMLEDAITGAKGVIHLAAVSRVLWCLENLEDCTDVNVRGTELVINALKEGWFIQASSREVYGNIDTLPVAEDVTRSPANVYGKSKAEAEDVITSHVKAVTEDGSKHINAVMLRLSNVYGSTKDHPERLIPAIIRNALSNRPIQVVGGDQDLDMVFVEDVVDAISLAVTRLDRKSNRWVASAKGAVEVFNVGTSSSTSVMSLIQKTLWLTNSSSPIRIIPADNRFPSRYVGSTVKASSVLGYKARVTIDEGLYRLATNTLRETVGYLRGKQAAEPFSCTTPKQYTINDLLRLDGCSGLFYVRGPEGETQFNQYYAAKPPEYNNTNKFLDFEAPTVWNFNVKPANQDDDREARVSFWVGDEKNNHTLGIPQPQYGVESEYEFLARVEPSTGYISLRKLSGEPLNLDQAGRRRRSRDGTSPAADAKMPAEPETELDYNFRLTPTCCTEKPAPWPFYRDDALASNILDDRKGTFHYFNASQISTVCSRLQAAKEYAASRVETLESFSFPIVLQKAPLPQGRAPDWRLRRYPQTCTNLCDHPTFCVDTGSCMCTHAAQCTPRTRFPFSDVANMDTPSYPPPEKESSGTSDDALVKTLSRSSWVNIINQDARRYFGSSPEWPPFTSVLDTDDVEQIKKEKGDEFYQLHNSHWGCFSADTAMERAAQHLTKPYQLDQSLVFVPFYTVNDFVGRFPDLPHVFLDPSKQFDHAMTQLPLKDRTEIDPNDVIMTFSFDFGRCNNGNLNVLSLRQNFKQPSERHRRVTAWGPMGDLNSECYYPDQDVVIPSRTCLQTKLREVFGDVINVRPVRQRGVLATFKGRYTPQGTWAGVVIRQKFHCNRPMSPGNLEGGEHLANYWHKLKPGGDYFDTINDSIFCPLPRGTTGWATRTADVIYAGCIPVLIGQETHHPFWDVLDWSKFAVFVNEWDIERLEEILLSYTWEQLEQMQANLMLVRDAFLYPEVGREDEALQERTPFWFATHSTWLRKLTKYPT